MIDVPGEVPSRSTVRHPVEELHGMKVIAHHRNPLMDTQEYELVYDYGIRDNYFANNISENLY